MKSPVMCLSWIASLAAIALSLVSPVSAADGFPEVDLSFGLYRIKAEVAATEATRTRGLMFRESLPANQGMLFVFPVAAAHCMWMRNTPLPLSVAFLDQEGRIINVEEMKPHTETNHCAEGRARFALEMNAGWFARHGVKSGARIRGLENVPAAR